MPPADSPLTSDQRDLLVQTLVYHQATNTSGCHCGWAELGRSHPEHVVGVYEMALTERLPDVG